MILIMTSSPCPLEEYALYRKEGCFLCRLTLRCLAISRIALQERLDFHVRKVLTVTDMLVGRASEGWGRGRGRGGALQLLFGHWAGISMWQLARLW